MYYNKIVVFVASVVDRQMVVLITMVFLEFLGCSFLKEG
jgi:hypothetical protein